MVQSVFTTAGIIIQATGKAGLQFRLGIVNTATVIIAIVIGLKWGVLGITSAYTIAQCFWGVAVFWVMSKLLRFHFRDVVRVFWSPTSAMLLTGLCNGVLIAVAGKEDTVLFLVLSIAIGFVTVLFSWVASKEIVFHRGSTRVSFPLFSDKMC